MMRLLCVVFIFCQGSFGDQFPELDFYSFLVHDLDGNPVKLEQYRGKVSLVVNVASQCGYTEAHYKALKRMQDILGFTGKFNVLAFPCNQFGEQESGTSEDIKQFVAENYAVEFPIFSKIDVIGDSAHPAFRNVVAQSSVHPEWNFYKYLVDGNGRVLKAWSTKVTVEEIFSDVQKAVRQAEKENPFVYDLKDEVFGDSEEAETVTPKTIEAPLPPTGALKDEL